MEQLQQRAHKYSNQSTYVYCLYDSLETEKT